MRSLFILWGAMVVLAIGALGGCSLNGPKHKYTVTTLGPDYYRIDDSGDFHDAAAYAQHVCGGRHVADVRPSDDGYRAFVRCAPR